MKSDHVKTYISVDVSPCIFEYIFHFLYLQHCHDNSEDSFFVLLLLPALNCIQNIMKLGVFLEIIMTKIVKCYCTEIQLAKYIF